MGHIRWQTAIALVSILLLGVLLGYLAYSLTTVIVPDFGGPYVEGVAGNPKAINPILQNNEIDRDLVSLVFSSLARVDERGEIVPELARRWEISEDGLVYTFYLRQDVRWHDGAPFSADDVMFTIQAIQDPDFQGLPDVSEPWLPVTIEKVDRYAVRFTLEEPFAPFLDYTTVGILPAHLLGTVPAGLLPSSQFNLRPVGTGPFMLSEMSAQHAILETNPHWYRRRPYLDKIEFVFYPDYPSIFVAHERGDVSGISRVWPDYLDDVREGESLNMYSAPLSGYTLVFLNLTRPLFQEREVRQALLWALDRQGLVDEVLGGQGIVVYSPIMPNAWAYDENLPRYSYDAEKAIALLEAAGWTDADGDGVREKGDLRLEFELLTNDDPIREQLVQEIVRQWAAVGVLAKPRVAGWPEPVATALRTRQFDALLGGWGALPPDPDPYPHWHSSQASEDGQNYAGYINDDADMLLEEARRVNDRALRGELYREFQRIFVEDVPALLLYQPVYNYAVDERVRGVQVGPMLDSPDRFRTVTQWYIAVKRVVLSEAPK
jgi:peptide/nickel transport system substrate-binding protein